MYAIRSYYAQVSSVRTSAEGLAWFNPAGLGAGTVYRLRARSEVDGSWKTSDAQGLRTLKRKGFSDRRLAYLLKTTEHAVRARRHALGIRPVFKRVDTCA